MSTPDRSPSRRAVDVPGEVSLDTVVDLDRLYSLRAAVSAHAHDLGMDEEQLGKLLVVANELATNAIRHADGTARLRLWRSDDAVYCHVTDEGPGIRDPDAAGTATVALNATGGRGLWIVRQLSDSVVIESSDSGLSITAVLHL